MMEQRLANMWWMTVNDKNFITTSLFSDIRIDGRSPFDYRNVTIQFGSEDGSSEVQLGQTRVLGFVKSQLVQPYRDRPNEGTLAIFTEFSPMADPSFEIGRPGEFAVELGRVVDRGLRESRAVDTESLCVVAGKWVWSIRIDLHIVDNGGNLVDAANIAALAALLTFRRPECTLGGDDGQEVIIHPPEVREPLPLIVHHLPVAVTFAFIGSESSVVIDPSHFEETLMGGKLTATLNTSGDVCAIQKAGGECVSQSVIMQCLRIASVKAADITGKIKKAAGTNLHICSNCKKNNSIEVLFTSLDWIAICGKVEIYNTSRALKKIKRHPDTIDITNISKDTQNLKIENRSITQDDGAEIGNRSSKKDGNSLEDNKPKALIGGPSSWGPYSKGINADELKASLASRAVMTPSENMDELPPIKRQFATMNIAVGDAEPAHSSLVTAATGEPTNKARTLMDAVKPKHKSRKKLLNTAAS